ncbi:unnamed protein product [Symbiodinium sp. CCMP2456]|nr:unnamed protein product [Symbiodinium sp. CCMP2456]
MALWLSVALVLAAHGLESTESTSLLQHKIVLQGPSEAEPLTWIHFPKCGGSFINAIVHLPGFCPSLANVTLGGDCFEETFWPRCQNVCNQHKFSCSVSQHEIVGNYTAKRGRMVGFFRDPDQRILSAYHFQADTLQLHPCGVHRIPPPKPRTLQETAESVGGGMTYQLVSEYQFAPSMQPNFTSLTREDAAVAAQRVQEGFAFVGITEMWDLSICLFHKMFGGPCLASDFDDSNPSSAGKTAHADYNTSDLMGWHDDIDEVVYASALDVFHKNLILYKVSHSTCRECYRQAGRVNPRVA